MKIIFHIRFPAVFFALWLILPQGKTAFSSDLPYQASNNAGPTFERMMQRLRPGDEPRRIEAASWLKDQGIHILPLVRRRLETERNPLCLKILIGWVALHEQSEACPELLSLLNSDAPDVAIAAGLCAGRLGCPGAADQFADVAEQSGRSSDVRVGMARSLGFLGKSSADENRDRRDFERAEASLIRLLRPPVAPLQAEAVGALLFMNARKSESALKELEGRTDPYLSFFAQRARRELFPAGSGGNAAGGTSLSDQAFRFSLPYERPLDSKFRGEVFREIRDPLERASAVWSGDRRELVAAWESLHGKPPERSLPRYFLVLPDRDRLPLVEKWLEDPLNIPNQAAGLWEKFRGFLFPGSSRFPVLSGGFARTCRALVFPDRKENPSESESRPPFRPAQTLSDLLSEVRCSQGEKAPSAPESPEEPHNLLPETLSVSLAELLASIIGLHQAWESALKPLPLSDRSSLEKACLDRTGTEEPTGLLLNRISKTVADLRLDAVWEAEDRLLDTLSRTAGVLGAYKGWSPDGRADWSWSRDTPYGKVALFGNGAHRIPHQGCLIVDFGGNDEWIHEEPDDGKRPRVQVYLDLAGDDSYRSGATPGFGGAVMGLGLVLDLEGDDRYVCEAAGLGAAVLGTGILVDRSGDDVYAGKRFCQGAAAYGTGILADLSGRDRFTAESRSQGYGETRGLGVLVDISGDDSYALGADATDGAKNAVHGMSPGQGCGMGFRLNSKDALSGGVGLLIDLEGHDVYEAGSLAQGTGYWFSVGALIDAGGNDTYSVQNYGQGAGIHAGAGLLLDVSGADRYLGRHHAVGCGLDRGGGILFDVSGNDEYVNETDAQGAGVKPLGFGVLVDHEGDDRYRALVGRGYCRLPAHWPSLWPTGLFYDGSGTDSYEGDPGMGGNLRIWTQNRYGFGVDAD